jgi:hypothetical protein
VPRSVASNSYSTSALGATELRLLKSVLGLAIYSLLERDQVWNDGAISAPKDRDCFAVLPERVFHSQYLNAYRDLFFYLDQPDRTR